MFENLSEKLEGAFKNLKGEGQLTEINIAQSIKDIRRALVAADVNYKIAKEFTDKVKEKALGSDNILNASVCPTQNSSEGYQIAFISRVISYEH